MYDDTDRTVPLFLKRAAQGKSLTVFGKDKVVDFTHIDDTTMAIINGIDRFEHVKNKVFNIAGSYGVPLLTVAELIKSKLNSESSIVLEENRVGEIVKYVADISRAKLALDYTPETDIEEGLDKTIRWYLQCQQPLIA